LFEIMNIFNDQVKVNVVDDWIATSNNNIDNIITCFEIIFIAKTVPIWGQADGQLTDKWSDNVII